MDSKTGKIDEQLLLRAAREGDQNALEALVERYSVLVKICARPYFLAGADGEDLIQEGMIGLLSAVSGYDAGRGVPFEQYARICVNRRIYSAVRAAASQKHEPLNHFLSLEKPLFEDRAKSCSQAPISVSDPETLVIGMEEQRERLSRLRALLSVFETQVLTLYLDGCSYQEIADRLHKPFKSVDNAIQRIRRKSASAKL